MVLGYLHYYQAIIGIGINVNLSKEILDSIDQPATSMAQENNGETFDLRSVLLNVLKNINKIQKQDSECISYFLNKHLALVGQRILIHDDDTNSVFEASINGLKDGKLIVTDDNDTVHEIINGTVQSLPNDIL